MSNDKTVQDLMVTDLIDFDGGGDSNETLQLLEWFRLHGTPMAKHQMQGILLLNESGLNDISEQVITYKQHVSPVKLFFRLIEKLTLADRIKGNAKLSHLLKASANPAQGALKPDDVQAKGLKKSEIDR